MRSGGASRTAVLTCQGRAAADGLLAVGAFGDPVAARLLGAAELEPVLICRSGARPSDGHLRFAVESVRACAEIIVPRTVAIDEALTDSLAAYPPAQVVLLGAGLDARPWRLPALVGRPVFAVDHPASQADAVQRASVLGDPPCQLSLVPVDLTQQSFATALADAGHAPDQTTIWVWEGVVPYLTPHQVAGTVQAISDCSPPGSQLIVNYQERSWVALIGRFVSGAMARLARADNPLSGEPWRSTWTPDSMAALLVGHRWSVDSDHSLLQVAGRIGSPTRRAASLANGRVAIAQRL